MAETRRERAEKSQWDTYREGFTLNPGAEKVGWPIPQRAAYRTRTLVEAKFPVFVSYIPDMYADVKNLPMRHPMHYCPQEHVLHIVIDCRLDTTSQGYVLYIRDLRETQSSSVMTGEPQEMPNHVQVAVWETR